MFRSLLRRIRLKLRPVKRDDIFTGDSRSFVTASSIEYILFGMKDKGGDFTHTEFVGNDTYRLTIKSTSMPYYVCKAEVLVRDIENKTISWMERRQERRIPKDKFHEMIFCGTVSRQ